MTEWGVVGVIIALVGLATAIVTPIMKLTKSIVQLNSTASSLKEQLVEFKNDNTESHKRIWEHEDKQDAQIGDHEKRIIGLEKTHER